ncbi:MAG: polysaccharide deacetylase family protein [Jatrophihabitans sp.]|nr:MAG: polysaccharide deacetylase family protein [Jatrophihabitans sp.]
MAVLLAGVALAGACGLGSAPPPPRTSGPAAPSTLPPTTGPGTTAATTPVTTPVTPTTTPTTPSATTTPPPPPVTTPPPPPTGLPGRLLGTDWTQIPTGRPVVALTFDCGASDAGAASILATLAANHVPATFFLTGQFAQRYPVTARRMAAGYRVGNHSMTHPHLTALTDAQVRAQVLDAATAIRAVTGADPAPWFRFPYGDRTAHTIAVVNALGYVPVRWTVDTLGWQGTSGGRSAASVLARVLASAGPGEIVLMHVGANPDDGTTLDADALPAVITRLRARGYGFVTLDALLTG